MCFRNKVNTNCGGSQLLVSGSQGTISRVPGVRVPCPRVATPKSQSPMVPSLGSRVSGPDFRLCPSKHVFLPSSYRNQRNKRIAVIELRHKNEQNVIICISCEEISNNSNLLFSHIGIYKSTLSLHIVIRNEKPFRFL